ncbi:probable inactive poly [ADP-ribose] polymerase SRO5 [Cryptomeria japonica]|uniref:probable inactive poly [ADP-ribose] polymerase SRO5 n=1 Tax=Cryptomeria japonica TaxID=3369 RepID=UPI0027DA2A35|nr:probable inactive poly [ADP-ribose] polymerase SRO5 [Cryptomeria japonica]
MDAKGQLRSPLFVDKAKLKRKQAVVSFLKAKKRSSVPPAKRAKIPGGIVRCCSDGKAVVENYSNFRKSGIPARVMYFFEGGWTDFQSDVAVLLKQAFQDGKTAVEVAVDGVSCLVDFLHMVQIDLKSAAQRSIAWIDVDGNCFFPRNVCDGKVELGNSSDNVEIDVRFHGADRLGVENCRVVSDGDPKSGQVEDSSEQGSSDSCVGSSDVSDSECPTSVRVFAVKAFVGTGDNLIKLDDHDRDFFNVRDKFLAGLTTLASYTSVVAIYRNSHCGVAGQSRLHAFERHADFITRKNGGDANIQCAWHGTSRDAVCGIITHGFGQPKTPKHGAALGKGVYLAPVNCSYVSAAYSDVDENGEQHMVLCRVILGNTELVRSGSQQCHPTNEEFDTGIDDLTNPRRYIVWSTHMNTHILPEYVVSFKVAPQLKEYWSRLKARQHARSMLETDGGRQSYPASDKKSEQPCPALVKESRHNMQEHLLMPTSAWMSFPRLFNVIEKFLPSSSINLMKKHYADYKESKISREDLIRSLRMIAGDRLLISAIKMFRGQAHPPMNEKMSLGPKN